MSKKDLQYSKDFQDGGLYVMRSKRIYLLAVCHRIGVNGIGPHKHNDWLSFELCVDNTPVIIDPGTYCYTGNMEMRRLFRSTAYHNTVVIDGEEQIPIHDSSFGLIRPKGDIHVYKWLSNNFVDVLKAGHTGYKRLSQPVVHHRTFILNKVMQEIKIVDSFQGKGKHLVEFNFHLNKELRCEDRGDVITIMEGNLKILIINIDHTKYTLEFREGWISKAYNRKESAYIITWKTYITAEKNPVFVHWFKIPEHPDP